MTSLAVKTTITKSSAGHYWVRVRSECLPEIFDGDAYPDRLAAKMAVKKHAKVVREKVIAEAARMNASASQKPTFTE